MPQPRSASNRKPPIPWRRIRDEYEFSPDRPTACFLSKKYSPDPVHPRPTRQGNEYRIRTHGWERKELAQSLAKTCQNATTPPKNLPLQHRDPALYAKLIENYAVSGTFTRAARAVGINRNTLWNWRKADGQLEQALDVARAQQLVTLEGAICDAAKLDWKAASYLLERARETTAEYGKGLGKGKGPTFVLAIPRGERDGNGQG